MRDRIDPVADGVLHPRVRREDEVRRRGRADRDDPDRREVDFRPQAIPAEDPQTEERGLEEERGEPLHRERRAEDVADVLGVRRPVHPELKLLDDARDDAEREVDQKQLAEETGQPQPALVMGPVPRRLERCDEPDEPDRDRDEQKVVERRDGELPAGEVESAHARQAAQPSQNPHRWLLRITLTPMSVYRTPDERFADLPGYAYRPHYLEQDGLRMHYVDEGAGDPVLLLHGEPTWAFLYRKLIPELVGSARCIAPDYFGFGRSDKPTEPGFYTYDRHVESISRFAAALDLRNITLVVQDWGGPIGFRFAVESPERIARLVVLNTGIGARAPSEEWLRFQAFMRRVGTEIVAGQLIRLSLVQPVADEVISAYDAPFPVPEARVGIVRFPELVPTSSEHPNAARMLEVREELRSFDRPALVLFSDSDPIFSRRAAEVMAGLLPNAELDPALPGAGHFLQEDQGETIGRRIAAFRR